MFYPIHRPRVTPRGAAKGQGVIEYAGALVMAMFVVSTLMSFSPEALAQVYSNIVSTVNGVIANGLSGL